MHPLPAPLAQADTDCLGRLDRWLSRQPGTDAEGLLIALVEAFPIDGAALVWRTPLAQVQAAVRTMPSLPEDLLAEACDADAVGVRGRTVALPLAPDRVLAVDADAAAAPLMAAARPLLQRAVAGIDAAHRSAAASDLLDHASRWRRSDPAALLEQLAETVCSVLDCDRATIFTHDAERGELVGAPALGVPGGVLRVPEKAGIVGDVFAAGRSERVADVQNDRRFHRDVDAEQKYTTETLLAAPMFRPGGTDAAGDVIGVVQAINKRGRMFDAADQWVAERLAGQAAAAIVGSSEQDKLRRRAESLQAQVAGDGTGTDRMVANGPAMTAIRDTISRLAQTDLPVLVLGESGTGKEVCSQALHEAGPRAAAPFVAVNCAALAETLLESELFGHEKGAFTDANETRAGKFELADGGTLFLDEVGDMSLGGQAKLLRVLEQKVVTRVGGATPIPVDVRIVAATNAKLTERIREGEFREDLYYRLAVVTIDLPPLRERPQDVLALAEHFLTSFTQRAGRPSLVLSDAAARRLQAHSWPGNVRELRNLMERVAFLAAGPKVEPGDLAFMAPIEREGDGGGLPVGLSLSDATADFQSRYIASTIERTQHNMTDAAEQLGLHRSNLYRKMRQLGMETS